MKKFSLFILGLLIGIIIFIPKDNIYYTLQKKLASEKIFINSEIENKISLNLKNGTIYTNDINIAQFEEIKAYPFLIFNKIEAKNIKINFQNLKINDLILIYSIINPTKIDINGNSNFGKILGEINIIKKFVKIYIQNITNPSLKSFLKRDKKGYFYYAKF